MIQNFELIFCDLLENFNPIFDAMNTTNEEKVVEHGYGEVARPNKIFTYSVQNSTQRTSPSKGRVQILSTRTLKVLIWAK